MPTPEPEPKLAALLDKHGAATVEDLLRRASYISYPEAALITTASVRTLKRETAAGNLPCYTIGRSRTLRVRASDVAKLIRRVA